MDYTIITVSYNTLVSEGMKKLQKSVTEYCKNGWVPQGGIVYIPHHFSGDANHICQAMIKE